jgi:DNA-binding MarR family transcriptional regulator
MDKTMENRYGALIRLIENAFKNTCTQILGVPDLTAAQMDVLNFLLANRGREMNQRDIENEFQITNPTVTGILNRLEKKGFVKRTVHPADKRQRIITITAKSSERERELEKKITVIEERIVTGFSREEQTQLRNFLQRMLKNLKT